MKNERPGSDAARRRGGAAGAARLGVRAAAGRGRGRRAWQRPFRDDVDEDAKTRLRDRYVVSAPLAGAACASRCARATSVAADAVVATLTPVLSPMLDERTLARAAAARRGRARRRCSARRPVERARVGRCCRRRTMSRAASSSRRRASSRPTKLESDRLEPACAAQKDLDAAREEGHVAGHEVEQARAALIAVQQHRCSARACTSTCARRSPAACCA